MSIVLGAIADDFTGATDLANTLAKEGMRAVQVIGVPDGGLDLGDAEVVVVALKSRTCQPDEAVRSSLAALHWLQSLGARQFFFKYCSTFDSTAEGNIGPVSDALASALDARLSIVCPAFPANGRTVYQGHLFVGDQLLHDSPMKDHPLTPMRESNVVELMAAQSARKVGLVPHQTIRQGPGVIAQALDALRASGVSYAVVDAVATDDLRKIGQSIASHSLITGGSGIALGLPENYRKAGALGARVEPRVPDVAGRAIILAGSCSQATRRQIAHAITRWPHLKLNADRLAAGEPVIEEAVAWSGEQSDALPLLIHASSDPQEVADVQARYGREHAGAMIEHALSEIASRLVMSGARRIIVAGGETAGAVVSRLEVRGLRIGREIDPGVPWTESFDERRLALALKSGNFGAEDFFAKALEMLS